MIPKIIHQTWKTNQVPKEMQNYVKSWKLNHPEYKYMFWTDHTIRQLIVDHYSWFLPYFDSYPHQIMRVDAFRIFALHKYGGTYADIDMECFKPVDPLLKEASLLLFLEWPGSVSNAIIASTPNHPFLELCFKALVDKHVEEGPQTVAWSSTGPKFLTEVFEQYKKEQDDYKLYPSSYFFPIGWHKPTGDQSGFGYMYPDSYGAHHWQGTWWQEQPNSVWLFWVVLITVIILCVGLLIVVLC